MVYLFLVIFCLSSWVFLHFRSPFYCLWQCCLHSFWGKFVPRKWKSIWMWPNLWERFLCLCTQCASLQHAVLRATKVVLVEHCLVNHKFAFLWELELPQCLIFHGLFSHHFLPCIPKQPFWALLPFRDRLYHLSVFALESLLCLECHLNIIAYPIYILCLHQCIFCRFCRYYCFVLSFPFHHIADLSALVCVKTHSLLLQKQSSISSLWFLETMAII